MPSSTIAVIGGTGFIGRYLLERLKDDASRRLRVLSHGPAPEWLCAMPSADVVRGDVLDPASLAPLLDGAEMVVNLAGQASPDVDHYQRVNLRGMIGFASACRRHRVRRVIHASSALVYGDALGAAEGDPCRPISPYATLKLAAEEILDGLRAPHLEVVALRLSNVYGPRQNKGLMPYLVNRLLNRRPITIDADGAQVRDFVHVGDAAEAFAKALTAPACGGVINIGSGVPTSIITLVRLLEDILAVPATGEYCPEHSGGERRSTVSVAKAAEVLDWRATIALADGARTMLSRRREWNENEVFV